MKIKEFNYDVLKEYHNNLIQFDMSSIRLDEIEKQIKRLIQSDNYKNTSYVNSEPVIHKQLFKYNFGSLNGGAKIIEKSNSI